ncbi:MAG TPA: ferredoxin reductase [Nevskiaceae bacterium]|nr:ferredoxin reductase [Nevskiaceae bacterium]
MSAALPALLRSPWLHPLNDTAALDDLLARIRPTWSLRDIRAEVTRVVDETPDTRSYWLAPNRLWRGHQAGQHVQLSLEHRGRRLSRAYSLSSAPSDSGLRLTIKRQPGGRMSGAVHAQLAVGSVLTLGPASGDFVLPEGPAPLFLLGAGSGITPLMAMLRTLAVTRPQADVVLLQISRRAEDTIFRAELDALRSRLPGLRLIRHLSAEQGRPQAEALIAAVADLGARESFICGPDALARSLRQVYAARGWSARFHSESFTGLSVEALPAGETVTVQAAKSEQLFTTDGSDSLLVAAEKAGLSPKYGCRIGICHSCKCVKRSGVVENLLTGEISDRPDQPIQLCISRARSALALDL